MPPTAVSHPNNHPASPSSNMNPGDQVLPISPLVHECVDQFTSLPNELTRCFSDLRELDAVLRCGSHFTVFYRHFGHHDLLSSASLARRRVSTKPLHSTVFLVARTLPLRILSDALKTPKTSVFSINVPTNSIHRGHHAQDYEPDGTHRNRQRHPLPSSYPHPRNSRRCAATQDGK